MLIARAPVRISFAGGGTDLAAYYSRYGGMVISSSIDKYIYGIVTKNYHTSFQVISADYQSVLNMPHDSPTFSQAELKLPQAIYAEFDVRTPVNVFLASEVPPGTGLGSSSTTSVLLCTIFGTLVNRPLNKQELAEAAYRIEIERMGAAVGKQDQYAAAFGGLNCIIFEEDQVRVEPLQVSRRVVRGLERRIMLFYTGQRRQADVILKAQREATDRKEGQVLEALHRIKELAQDMRRSLEDGDLDAFGEILHANWQHKKQLAKGVSNSVIDEAYGLARAKGARGGKITGAGGGGFLMLDCPEHHQADVRAVLEERGLCQVQCALDFEGARVLMHTDLLTPTLNWRGSEE